MIIATKINSELTVLQMYWFCLFFIFAFVHKSFTPVKSPALVILFMNYNNKLAIKSNNIKTHQQQPLQQIKKKKRITFSTLTSTSYCTYTVLMAIYLHNLVQLTDSIPINVSAVLDCGSMNKVTFDF